MAECPGGRSTRATRSQFRLGMSGLGQYKGFHPIHLGNMMDAGQSSQTGLLSSRNLSSPRKGTSTLTVREYEQTISELQKENFDLKLRLFILENALGKNYHKDGNIPDQNPIEVIVNLSTETESLRELLQEKDKVLQDALEQTEKYKIDFKELEKKCIELQTELSSLSELPSKEEFAFLINEKDSYLKHIEVLEKELSEKEQDMHDNNKKMEILAEQNSILEEKLKKRSLAIQGFVSKNLKEKEMLPDELRNIVISATQAAKKRNKEDLIVAMKRISSALHQMISSPVDLDKSVEKENIKSPPTKCLKEEFLEKSSIFLPSQNESCTELSHIQSLKQVLSEKNTPEIKQFDHLDSFIPESFVQGKGLGESAVNIAKQDIVDHLDFSTVSPAKEENLISFSTRCSSQSCSVGEYNPVNVKILTESSDVVHEKEAVSKPEETSVFDQCFEESCQLKNILKENEQLKLELTDKLAIIKHLKTMCKELELKVLQVKEAGNDALKASNQHSVYIQTNVTGCDLLEEMLKLQNDAKLSSNIDELREDILLLLLAIQDKNQELMDVKQSLSAVQDDLKNALNTTTNVDKNYYMNERNELHERLAFSCSVNEELMRHLRNLETFMEDLLQHKFDTSTDSINEKSSSFLYLTKCLSESLKLSNVLSDHLSICEGSKLFEECESSVYKNGSYSDDKSFSHLNLSQLKESEQHSLHYQGTHNYEEYIPYVRKSDQRMNIDFNVSQPCWQGWKQLNAPMNKLDSFHQMQSSTVPKNINYPSSESDIWSEPDRDISMQRIGISLQNSPVASKSPRKLRGKEKRLASRLTSEQDTSSTNSQRLSKKRHGSTSRRLFSKDNIKNQDFTSEKFYLLLGEKYTKLKSLLDDFESIIDGKVSDEVWIRLNTVVASLGESLQKLHIARENAKDFPSAVCGRCVMLELLVELKTSHKEADYYIENSSYEQDILQQFSKEIRLLKEACKEPFTFLSESIDKRSQSTQSETLTEQIKIDELESVILNLMKENKEINNNLDEVKAVLSKEKTQLESIENEKSKLLNQFKNLKEELSAVKEKEKDLKLKNKELIEELMHAESLDKSSRFTQSEALTEQIKIDELESVILNLTKENKEINNNLDEVKAVLTTEKAQLEWIKNENSKLLNQFKNLKEELSSMKEKEKDLKNKNKELIKELMHAENLDKRSQFTQSEALPEQIKIDELESVILNLTKENKEINNNLDEVKAMLSKEKTQLESIENENSKLLNQFNNLKEELSAMKEKEKDLSLKNEELIGELMHAESLDKRSQSTQSETLTEQIKIDELESVILNLTKENKKINNNLDDLKAILSKEKAQLESINDENSKLLKQFKILKDELSAVKEKEEDLSLKNKELIEELMHVNASNAELSFTLKALEEKNKESGLALDKLTAELHQSKCDLIKMNEKCLECEEKLDHEIHKNKKCRGQLKMLESTSLREKEMNLGKINELNTEKNKYMEQLKSIQDEKLALEKENASVKSSLNTLNKQLSLYEDSIRKLQKTNETLSDNCAELQLEMKNTKEQMTGLQKSHSLHEEEIKKLRAKETEYCQQLQQLEFDSSNEKKSLMNKISILTEERKDVIQKLEKKKECFEKLVKEMAEINGKYIENCEQVTSLKLLNEELKNKQSSLLQKNKFFENALQSSNSECDTLSKDLKRLRETLQNLESKCLVYEKQLVASAGMKDNLVGSILNISKDFSIYRKKLNEMCKTYGNENYVLWDEISDFAPVMDEENVEKLCDDLSLESKKLLQSVDMLLGLLKNFHLKSVETKTAAEKQDSKVANIQNEKQTLKVENKHIKLQNDELQKVINELQQSISEKEKSVQFNIHEIHSLKENLSKVEKDIEESHQLLKEKDDEIILLQERLFNLQTYLNNITPNETKLPVKTSSFVVKSMDTKKDSVSSDNQLSSEPFSRSSKMCQTTEQELSFPKTDDSFTSSSSLETSRNSCCDKYWKKNHSLLTKLALAKKRIEILEEEKNDLRKNFLQQLQCKQDSGRRDSADSKLAELELKLEQKKAFINELKEDLLKTCNSLIDKEKQLDDLRQKLSEYEAKSKHFTFDMPDRHSITLKTVDTNIKTLKSYKQRLIEKIFDIQRKFYEKKGIHLNYFDRFRDHVNNLYSMQLTHSISKSDSMPLLGSHASELRLSQEDDKIKNLVGLELDIECLGNLKIFLNRFFVPSVLEKMSQAADEDEIWEEEKKIESERQKLVNEITNLKTSNFEVADILNVSFPNIFDFSLSPENKDVIQEKSFSFEKFASSVSHHVDYIEKFFSAVKKCHWLESYGVSTQDCSDKMEVKSLLSNIFQEIKILQSRFDKIYELNSMLKKFNIIAAPLELLSLSRPDISDRESIMSEETIAVSHCESPVSFEDVVCSVKLPSPEMLMLEPSILKTEPLRKRVAVTESYGTTKITAVGSSCDSVCQRSHYSSPDLGIESDPNHDSSAPEQKDDGIKKYQRELLEEQKFINMSLQKSALTCTESAGRWSGHKFGETLYAIGNLPDYELLKKEVRECLVAIKSVLSRTGDGLHHIAKYTSPRKNLEYSTLKSIKDTCIHIEVCLKAAHGVVNKFWTAYCPSEKEWKHLRDQNQVLTDQLSHVKLLVQKQENEFKRAIGKLEHAQVVKANIEKKISKKLVKTKKVICQAELKLLQNRCQNFPPVPKYPSEQSEQSLPTNSTQQM